jgi:hypothetical protein
VASVWMPAFRHVERTVARPLERLAESSAAIDGLIRVTALQGELQRRAERMLEASLHLLNIPSLTDVRRLSQQMAHVERRVRELSRAPVDPPADLPDRDARAA